VDEVLQKLFSGGKDFAKLRLILFLHFVRPQKGVWGMNAGGTLDFLAGAVWLVIKNLLQYKYGKITGQFS
jgi:hypothetical protein